jgi:predicted GIY-YIG superfamily endonuclease
MSSAQGRHTDDRSQEGTLRGYTAKRRPVELVWTEMFASRDDAFFAERKLKGWSRAKKEALIVADWALISQLARGRTGRRPDAEVAPGPATSSG